MTPQFSHILSSSFVQWMDHTLLVEGSAFTNYGGKFFQMNDPKLAAGYSIYSLPFGQLVGDQSVPGAQIPSGVYVNGHFIPRGASGLHLDFQRGRAIFNPGNNGLNVSGNVAVKEFDILLSPVPEEQLLVSQKFALKPSFSFPPTGLAYDQVNIPVVFITNFRAQDDPLQLGVASEMHTANMRALVLASNDWQLDGFKSIFTAKKHKYFPMLTGVPYPFDYFGDVLGTGYDYNALRNAVPSTQLVYIKEARFSKFTNRANQLINPLLYMGAMDFSLEIHRI